MTTEFEQIIAQEKAKEEMNNSNYEHYFMVRATITDGVVSFALDSSVTVPHNKPLWNDDTGVWYKVHDAPLSVQDDDEHAYAVLFDRLLSRYKREFVLLDNETETIIAVGTESEMTKQQERSHGNLFVVSREDITFPTIGETMVTFNSLLTALLSVAPNATVSIDDDGQVIIHTNLSERSGSLEEMQ